MLGPVLQGFIQSPEKSDFYQTVYHKQCKEWEQEVLETIELGANGPEP